MKHNMRDLCFQLIKHHQRILKETEEGNFLFCKHPLINLHFSNSKTDIKQMDEETDSKTITMKFLPIIQLI